MPGIDAVYGGPGDLGMSMGLPPAIDREERKSWGTTRSILRACERRGIQAGLHTATAAYATRMMRLGSRFVVLASDTGLMMRAAPPKCSACERPGRLTRPN